MADFIVNFYNQEHRHSSLSFSRHTSLRNYNCLEPRPNSHKSGPANGGNANWTTKWGPRNLPENANYVGTTTITMSNSGNQGNFEGAIFGLSFSSN
jgi:hypothetical protein